MEAGSLRKDGGCFYSLLVPGSTLPIPTIQPNRHSTDKDSNRFSEVCLPYSSSLASAGLVSASTSDVGQMPSTPTNGTRPAAEPRPEPSSSSVRRTDVSSHMAHLQQTYAMQGFSERVTELLLQSWRANTHSAYNTAWSKWCGWCNQRQVHPFSASLEEIMDFLADQFDSGLLYRSLNALRSAISTSHSKVDSHNVGSHPLVSRLLKGMFNARPPSPQYNGSWDVSVVVELLRNHRSADLTIPELGKKVVTLMALANADRCSDLAALDRDYLKWTPSGVQFTVVQLTKTRTAGPPRTVHYSSLPEDAEACPVSTLHLYIERTEDQTAKLAFPKPVFITSRKPFRRARPGTFGRWIKDNLKAAGIDTGQFTAQSTRSASTS